MLQDTDPRKAIEAALGPAVARSTYVIEGRRVRVKVRPRAFAPLLAAALTSVQEADAGEEAGSVRRVVVRGGDGEDSRP